MKAKIAFLMALTIVALFNFGTIKLSATALSNYGTDAGITFIESDYITAFFHANWPDGGGGTVAVQVPVEHPILQGLFPSNFPMPPSGFFFDRWTDALVGGSTVGPMTVVTLNNNNFYAQWLTTNPTPEPPTEPPSITEPPTEPPSITEPPIEPPLTTEPPIDPPLITEPPIEPPLTTEPPIDPPLITEPPTEPPSTTEPPTESPSITGPSTEPPITQGATDGSALQSPPMLQQTTLNHGPEMDYELLPYPTPEPAEQLDMIPYSVPLQHTYPPMLGENNDAYRYEGPEHWALVNYILTLQSLVCGVAVAGHYAYRTLNHKKKENLGIESEEYDKPEDKEYDEPKDKETDKADDEAEQKKQKYRRYLVAAVSTAVAATILFILTEDMRLQMVLVDYWTILHVCISVISGAAFVLEFGLTSLGRA